MKKIAIMTIALEDEDLIGPCIDQFKGIVDKHYVYANKTPYYSDKEIDNSGTMLITMEHGATFLESNYKNEADARNYVLDNANNDGYNMVLIVDADEFYTKDDIRLLIDTINRNDNSAFFISREGKMIMYWKSLKYYMNPGMKRVPIVVAVDPKKRRFIRIRDIDSLADAYGVVITMHHMSFARKNFKNNFFNKAESHIFDKDKYKEFLDFYDNYEWGDHMDNMLFWKYTENEQKQQIRELEAPEEIINLLK